MDVFKFRQNLIDEYSSYIRSFIYISDERVKEYVDQKLNKGLLWPDPLIQLNPSFELGTSIDGLINEGLLHEDCKNIFTHKDRDTGHVQPLNLYKHQEESIRIASTGQNYVLTTGTGSGKSLAYIIPIVNHILKSGANNGIKAIIVYPMNALANSQLDELKKYVDQAGNGKTSVTFARYTGQENTEEKQKILSNPPDIILTNYMMLELILTRPDEKLLLNNAKNLQFLVFDELHTYRGRQGADVALLARRVKAKLGLKSLQYVGTSATMSSQGSYLEQRQTVADVASLIFGSPVRAENVVGETLKRITGDLDFENNDNLNKLKHAVLNYEEISSYSQFCSNPLASYIENNLGINKDDESNRFIRAQPESITGENGLGARLAKLIAVDQEFCENAIKKLLINAYKIYQPNSSRPAMVFRMHQFISRGDTVFASLEEKSQRYITLFGQKFVPDNKDKILLPLVFCRDCGQEYYCVSLNKNLSLSPRNLMDKSVASDSQAGFIYINSKDPWPEDEEEIKKRVPEDWLEIKNKILRIKSSYIKKLPQKLWLNVSGNVVDENDESAVIGYFVNAPFRFCLCCNVVYDARAFSDFGKLATLSSEGRSTATSILSLSAIRFLKQENSLDEVAQKLLSFTDNRQDASLQAGHFNDFVEVCLIRSALCRALINAKGNGISYEDLTDEVFKALSLPIEAYANNPNDKFGLNDTQSVFKNVLGYKIFLDLKRGYRITSPNLEQSSLLEFKYEYLDELSKDEELWLDKHDVLVKLDPRERYDIAKVLLDHMRRELAIHVNYLNFDFLKKLEQMSNQKLKSPWLLESGQEFEVDRVIFPRLANSDNVLKMKRNDRFINLTPRSAFGRYLGRRLKDINKEYDINQELIYKIIQDLFKVLENGPFLHRAVEAKKEGESHGYQVNASAFKWYLADENSIFHDPIKIYRKSFIGKKPNEFFCKLYKNLDTSLINIEAREHTAQITSEEREIREQNFRCGKLPILYCSPTMELGVDIADLNIVNMRNVPPTPANYAQRSGRAGRSGQPALVFTYCTSGSNHDQYFFKRPNLMVSGSVSPPRIDLTNEELLRSHIHAIWLAETGQSLGVSLKEILDVEKFSHDSNNSIPILESVEASLNNASAKKQGI